MEREDYVKAEKNVKAKLQELIEELAKYPQINGPLTVLCAQYIAYSSSGGNFFSGKGVLLEATLSYNEFFRQTLEESKKVAGENQRRSAG